MENSNGKFICYKLFRKDANGSLHPLYIGAKDVVPAGVSLTAVVGPSRPTGSTSDRSSAIWRFVPDGIAAKFRMRAISAKGSPLVSCIRRKTPSGAKSRRAART